MDRQTQRDIRRKLNFLQFAQCAAAEYGSGRHSGGDSNDGGDSGGVCELAPKGDSCTVNSDCCSNSCKGKQGNKTCK